MKKVYIFGIGKGKEILKGLILWENVQVLAYVDNYAHKYINKSIDGLQVIKPQEMSSEVDYIIISLMQYRDIENQLLKIGVAHRSIIKFFSFEDSENPAYWKVLKKNEWRIELMVRHYQKKVIPYLNNIKYEIIDLIKNEEIKNPIILSAEKAIEKICDEHVSLARFGDGEFDLIQMRSRYAFQTTDMELAERLKKILQSKNDKILIAIADNYGSLDKYTENAADAIRQYLTPSVRLEHMSLLDMDRTYYDAYLSRPYFMYRDKKGAKERFRTLKQIWNKQDILLVEGQDARNGIGNDLFDNASSIHRILAPNKNAYSRYHELFEEVCVHGKNKLVLISLGAAATVLAYDLAAAGYWAVDIGQVDMEYEWFLKGIEEKCDISYKNISEVKDGDIVTELESGLDKYFRSQIVERIGQESVRAENIKGK